jgi:hypothetical protein
LDPGSEIRKNLSRIRDPEIPIPDPGSKRHRTPDLDPQHCYLKKSKEETNEEREKGEIREKGS